ncbi:hypothetical protein [Variovorax brevis]|uniref:hypothetical protein n=1 Tax=Variovorax brevis TaxID=3053503 RepID=UPI0033654F7E
MTPATPAVPALRQRMLDDMRMRKLEPKTQSTCIRAMHLAGFLQLWRDDPGERLLILI